MSELMKKLKIVEIIEYKQIEAEKKHDDTINQLECVEAQNSTISPNLSVYRKDTPNLDQLRTKIHSLMPRIIVAKITESQRRSPKPHVTAYKQYTRVDILAALEEVKKGRSALHQEHFTTELRRWA